MAFLLALLVHGAFVGALVAFSSLQENPLDTRKPLTRKPSAVVVRPLTAEQWAKNRGDSRSSKAQPTEPPRLEAKKEKKDEEKLKGPVVRVPRGNEQEAPDAKYLAERDNKVEKETKAREQTTDFRNAMPQQTAPQARHTPGDNAVDRPQVAGTLGAGQDDRPMNKGQDRAALELPDVRKKQEIALKTDPDSPGPGMSVANRSQSDELKGNSKRLRLQPGSELGEPGGSLGKAGLPGVANLVPSRAVMDKLIGAAPNEYLPEEEEGDGTFLNTRSFKYAGFFNRIKQALDQYYDIHRIARRDPTGTIYFTKDRITLLHVTLNAKGELEDIRIVQSSGLDFLDMEAVAAFRRAQPFPNPPPGMLDEDSKLRIPYGIVVEAARSPRIRFFRSAR